MTTATVVPPDGRAPRNHRVAVCGQVHLNPLGEGHARGANCAGHRKAARVCLLGPHRGGPRQPAQVASLQGFCVCLGQGPGLDEGIARASLPLQRASTPPVGSETPKSSLWTGCSLHASDPDGFYPAHCAERRARIHRNVLLGRRKLSRINAEEFPGGETREVGNRTVVRSSLAGAR